MKTAVKSDLKSQTFFFSKSFNSFREKEISLVNFKFYQKLFVVLMSFSIILIFPEFPIELENVCESYNSKIVCNVW